MTRHSARHNLLAAEKSEGFMKRVSAILGKLLPVVLFAAILMTTSVLVAQGAPANQPAVIKPGDNLVVENIPAVPVAIAEKANQYGEVRSAGLQTGTR